MSSCCCCTIFLIVIAMMLGYSPITWMMSCISSIFTSLLSIPYKIVEFLMIPVIGPISYLITKTGLMPWLSYQYGQIWVILNFLSESIATPIATKTSIYLGLFFYNCFWVPGLYLTILFTGGLSLIWGLILTAAFFGWSHIFVIGSFCFQMFLTFQFLGILNEEREKERYNRLPLIVVRGFFSFSEENYIEEFDNALNKVKDWNPKLTRKTFYTILLSIFAFFAPNLVILLYTWLIPKYFTYFSIFEYCLTFMSIFLQADLICNVLISSVYIYQKIDKGENKDLIELQESTKQKYKTRIVHEHNEKCSHKKEGGKELVFDNKACIRLRQRQLKPFLQALCQIYYSSDIIRFLSNTGYGLASNLNSVIYNVESN